MKLIRTKLLLAVVLSVAFGPAGLPAAWALDNPEAKVTAVIKEFITAKNPAWSRDEIKIAYKTAEKTFAQLAELPGDTQFKVLEGYPDFKPVGSVIFPLQATSVQGSNKFLLRAKVEVLKQIAVAAKLIKKGQKIEAADLNWAERDVALLPQKYFTAPEQLLSEEAKISIPENSTIFAWMAGPPPLVRGGQAVTLVATAAGLTVRAKGEALSDGYRDEVIQVKRLDADKVLQGKVVSAAEVEVNVE
jgi:flagella basal body P-ring formation protein FlgA